MPRLTTDQQKAAILSGQWPYYPVLPLTRRPHGPRTSLAETELGVLLAGEWHVVYLLNLFLDRPRTPADVKTFPALIYDDLDALLAAGWVGD